MRLYEYHASGYPVYNHYLEYLKQPHLLIAGATGSGKSVIINGLITTILNTKAPSTQLILIDPKRVELCEYKQMPHTIRYASEQADMISALCDTIDLMENRYSEIQSKSLRLYPGGDLYIFVDEYADLITTSREAVEPLIIRLAQLGRASKIHLVLATQRPTRDIVTGRIKVNLDSRIALRCPTAQDSRNILEQSGAENLPRYGQCYYLSPDTMTPEWREVPMYTEQQRRQAIDYWLSYKPKRIRRKEAKQRGLI